MTSHYMILEASWGTAFGHFSFGLSQFHGHGRWLVCEVALRACNHYTSSTLIGGKGGAGPSSFHTTVEGPTE